MEKLSRTFWPYLSEPDKEGSSVDDKPTGKAGKAGDPAETAGDGIFATYVQGEPRAQPVQNAARNKNAASTQTLTSVTEPSMKQLLERIEALETRVKALESN